MNLVYLQTFCVIARCGSFTQAAMELDYAQSSVTTQIQKLEDEYGVVLFERHGKGMALTQAGKVLLGYATNILQLYEESKEIITHQTVGTMTIGTIETLAAFFLPPFLQRFRQMHPSMNLLLQPGNEATLIQAVREGEYDTGFLLDELCTDPDLYCVPIREEELVIIAHPKHKICARSTVTINDLAKETLILTEDGCTYRAMLLRALQQNGISYQLSFECGSLEAIKQCVIYSLGIALLPRMTVNSEVEQGQVIAMPFACPHPKFYTQLIYRKKKWVSRALQDFIGLFEEVGKNRI